MNHPITAIAPDFMAVDTTRIQYFAIAGSALLLIFIITLARTGRIRIPYSLLWLAVGAVFLVVSIWRDALDSLARLVGVAYPPAALFLILVIGIFCILIHFSVVISRLS
ncbi:MAG: DUF2304 domain-containing protein, partial [Chitinispirillaceae bacterium]|nr:DUF2304 domain-containing protein [Chitinispirillaceae bacterium]